MAARYVWSKYSLTQSVSLETGSRAANAGASLQIAHATSGTGYFALCKGLSYDADAETFSPSGTYKLYKISDLSTLQAEENDDGTTYYYTEDNVSVTTYPYLILNADSSDGSGSTAVTASRGYWCLYRAGSARAYVWNDYVAIYQVAAAVTYSQGSTGYGYISSATSGTYGTSTGGTVVGSYWYVYEGADSITPSALSCSTATPAAGETVTLSVTAASNTWGGTITYTYEVSTDGGDSWETISSTTGTEVAYTVPDDVETVTFRVTAADNYGFTDTDSVTTATLSVVTNTAPTAPGAPVITEDTVLGGESITLTWTAATDEDDNLSGYILERSYNGGSFLQIYQGSGLTASDSITWGWATVQYRVCAYDSYGEYSDYATGESTEVVNNTAPEAPATLTLPASIYNGISFKLSWSAASDTDDNLAGYTVEVSTDGGTTWTDTGLTPGADDTSAYYAVSDAEQVQMRIQAYDTYAYTSDWTYSATRTLITNTAPVLTVAVDGTAYDSGSDPGEYTDAETGPALTITVTDADADTCTVTVTLDSTAFLETTAESGETVSLACTAGGDPDWQTILNGTHTLTVTADDGTETAGWTGTFTKTVTKAEIRPAAVKSVDGTITGVLMVVNGSIPDDAELTVLATADGENYEDITAAVTAGSLYSFTNPGSAFRYSITAERGETAGSISTVQGVLIVE